MTPGLEIEPRPHWWEPSPLTTEPPLLQKTIHNVTSGSWSVGMVCTRRRKNKGKQRRKRENATKQRNSRDRTDLLHDVIQFCKQQNTPNMDTMTINENYAHNISSKKL